MNRNKNEQKLINNFKKIFGKPEETIVIFGDFEQKQHMKYKEPIKRKGMRILFRQNNYKTFLNIYRIAKNAINGLERPKYLCREKKNENIKVENPKKEKIKKVVQKKANNSVRVDALTKP